MKVDEDDTKPKEASNAATPAASDLAKAADRAKHRDVKKLLQGLAVPHDVAMIGSEARPNIASP